MSVKATGIVRSVDSLGRIVLPKELRRTLGIQEDSSMEIYMDNDAIILKKYAPACIFCSSMEDVREFHRRLVCGACRAELAAMDAAQKEPHT